ncbi:MAG: hypothetical protein AAB947_01365 [Patescibacteria group bacterium]
MTKVVEITNINRFRTSEQVLTDTGRKVYSNPAVVLTMPRGTASSALLHIFEVYNPKSRNGRLLCSEIAEEYRQRGLRADVEALADYLKKNPAAADEKWLACQWKDASGYWFAAFYRWLGERGVYVGRYGLGWRGAWLFAGVPQES